MPTAIDVSTKRLPGDQFRQVLSHQLSEGTFIFFDILIISDRCSRLSSLISVRFPAFAYSLVLLYDLFLLIIIDAKITLIKFVHNGASQYLRHEVIGWIISNALWSLVTFL